MSAYLNTSYDIGVERSMFVVSESNNFTVALI